MNRKKCLPIPLALLIPAAAASCVATGQEAERVDNALVNAGRPTTQTVQPSVGDVQAGGGVYFVQVGAAGGGMLLLAIIGWVANVRGAALRRVLQAIEKHNHWPGAPQIKKCVRESSPPEPDVIERCIRRQLRLTDGE